MKKRWKALIIIIAIVLSLVIAGAVLFSTMMKRFEAYLTEVEIEPPDLHRVEDGTYLGEVNTGVIIVKLEVDISDHTIRDIRLLEHRNGQGADAERIIPMIIKEQRIDVDVITGATYSSLVIQDAICRALISGTK